MHRIRCPKSIATRQSGRHLSRDRIHTPQLKPPQQTRPAQPAPRPTRPASASPTPPATATPNRRPPTHRARPGTAPEPACPTDAPPHQRRSTHRRRRHPSAITISANRVNPPLRTLRAHRRLGKRPTAGPPTPTPPPHEPARSPARPAGPAQHQASARPQRDAPCRVIVISSPRSTRSSTSGRVARASLTLSRVMYIIVLQRTESATSVSPPRHGHRLQNAHPVNVRMPRSATWAFDGGGAGNRTRVLRCFTRASPCAVRSASTRTHRSCERAGVTIPVAVWCPCPPRDRADR